MYRTFGGLFCFEENRRKPNASLKRLEQRQRCYRLRLLFVALCQSISLGRPIPRKSILVHPHQLTCVPVDTVGVEPTHRLDGGGGESCTRVFPPLLLPVNN